MLTGTAAAGGIAMINAVGNLGGWFGPSVYGMVKDATGSANIGLLCLAVGPLLTAIVLLPSATTAGWNAFRRAHPAPSIRSQRSVSRTATTLRRVNWILQTKGDVSSFSDARY